MRPNHSNTGDDRLGPVDALGRHMKMKTKKKVRQSPKAWALFALGLGAMGVADGVKTWHHLRTKALLRLKPHITQEDSDDISRMACEGDPPAVVPPAHVQAKVL